MAFTVHDRKVIVEVDKLQQWLQDVFGIENCSKEDVIRYLIKLKQDKKGFKKDDIKWHSL